MRLIARILMLSVVLGLAACAGSGTPGRYTYVLRYALTGTIAAAADVTYADATGTGTTVAGVTVPWSVEFTMDYDYADPLVPDMCLFNTTLNNGEAVTLTISWEDYKVGFQDEVLAERTRAITTGGPLPLDITLFAAPLPP